jgi:hypothetical protein
MDKAAFYNALEIVLSYLTLRGYEQSEASERARRHMFKLCIAPSLDAGERRDWLHAIT